MDTQRVNTMMSSEKKIRRQAQYWVTEVTSADVTAETLARFDAWKAENPLHDQLYRQVENVFFGLSDIDELAAIEPLDRKTLQERLVSTAKLGFIKGLSMPYRWGAAVTAALALVAVVAVIKPSDNEISSQQYSTAIAEIRNVTLEDGSTVTLDANSNLNVTLSGDTREVTLLKGRAFFSVSEDAQRPFTVATGNTVVTVLGTRFDVRKGVTEVSVGVEEGKVSVSHKMQNSATDEQVELTAGQQVTALLSSGLETVQPVDGIGQWRQGRLVYVNAPLVEITADANRYYQKRIVPVSDKVGQLRLTAVFRTDQIDDMLDTLKKALPIELSEAPDDVILVRLRQ